MDMTMTTTIDSDPITTSTHDREAAVLPGVDMGAIGLAAASGLLDMRIADLGSMLVAHAEADLVRCPVCRTHPRRAA